MYSHILYGSETWRSTETITIKLEIVINWCLRSIVALKWYDRIIALKWYDRIIALKWYDTITNAELMGRTS